MPLVSVIIPTFNRDHFLSQAVDSVLSQSFRDFELIIVDDGSTDNTDQIIERYCSDLTYIYQENSGVAAARNTGIRNANGLYLAFLDSDDLWFDDKLLTQMDLVFEQPELKICYTDEIWIRNGVRVNPQKQHQKYGGRIFKECLAMCFISASSVLIHHDIFDQIGLFDEKMIVCEDYDFWLRISTHHPVHLIEQPLILKTDGHRDQLSHKFWGMDRYRIEAINKILKKEQLKPEDRLEAISTLIKLCTIVGNGFLKRQKTEKTK